MMTSTGLRASRDWAGACGVTAWPWKAAACSEQQLFSLKTTRQALGWGSFSVYLGTPVAFRTFKFVLGMGGSPVDLKEALGG